MSIFELADWIPPQNCWTEKILSKGTTVLIGEMAIGSYENREKLIVPFERDKQKGLLLVEEISTEAHDFSKQWEHFSKEALWGRSEHNKSEASRRRDQTWKRLEALLREVSKTDLRIVGGKDAKKI